MKENEGVDIERKCEGYRKRVIEEKEKENFLTTQLNTTQHKSTQHNTTQHNSTQHNTTQLNIT